MEFLKTMTEQDLYNLDKSQLIDVLESGSKAVAQNIRRLKKSKYASSSLYIKSPDSTKIKEYKNIKSDRFTITQLRQEIRKLAYVARLKTSTVKGTKAYIQKMKENGVDITKLTSDDWENIRRIIDITYDSESAIAVYDSTESYENNMKAAIESSRQKSAEAARKALETSPYNVEK